VPVDERGLAVAQGRRRAAGARLAYATPSHQYPLGHGLALERRLELLAWAREAGAWIVEDDYDAELRYQGRPIAAVQGLDPDGRVVYVGTFTKLLFPSLRLAWAVVPGRILEPFVHARRLQDGHPPTLPQAVTADFLAEGHFTTWLRRLRAACAERRDALLSALASDLPEAVPCGAEAGLHLTITLPGIDDRDLERRALALGVEAPPLSSFRLDPGGPGGLVLGFAALPPPAIRAGVRALARALARARA
jgi:GntR family transcriptional regulator/MocR family aminotransferase